MFVDAVNSTEVPPTRVVESGHFAENVTTSGSTWSSDYVSQLVLHVVKNIGASTGIV